MDKGLYKSAFYFEKITFLLRRIMLFLNVFLWAFLLAVTFCEKMAYIYQMPHLKNAVSLIHKANANILVFFAEKINEHEEKN